MRHNSIFRLVALACVLVVTFASTGFAAAVVETAPPVVEPFDPSAFGRVLSPAELDKIEGNWWTIAAGVLIGAASHVAMNGVELGSWEWWAGLAVSVALGVVPVTGAQVSAGALSGAGKVAMEAWSVVAGTIVTTGPQVAIYLDEKMD